MSIAIERTAGMGSTPSRADPYGEGEMLGDLLESLGASLPVLSCVLIVSMLNSPGGIAIPYSRCVENDFNWFYQRSEKAVKESPK